VIRLSDLNAIVEGDSSSVLAQLPMAIVATLLAHTGALVVASTVKFVWRATSRSATIDADAAVADEAVDNIQSLRRQRCGDALLWPSRASPLSAIPTHPIYILPTPHLYMCSITVGFLPYCILGSQTVSDDDGDF
jgi:hypothetical protein